MSGANWLRVDWSYPLGQYCFTWLYRPASWRPLLSTVLPVGSMHVPTNWAPLFFSWVMSPLMSVNPKGRQGLVVELGGVLDLAPVDPTGRVDLVEVGLDAIEDRSVLVGEGPGLGGDAANVDLVGRHPLRLTAAAATARGVAAGNQYQAEDGRKGDEAEGPGGQSGHGDLRWETAVGCTVVRLGRSCARSRGTSDRPSRPARYREMIPAVRPAPSRRALMPPVPGRTGRKYDIVVRIMENGPTSHTDDAC